jgi:hypothetical protein
MSDLPPRRPAAPSRRRMTKAQRRAFYDAAKGDLEFPLCNICGRPILPCHKWVESHMPIPHAWKGEKTGVGHKRCNDLYWRKVEAPMMAKGRHQHDMACDIDVSRNPLPGGRDDPRKRKMDGTVVDRATGLPWRPRAARE